MCAPERTSSTGRSAIGASACGKSTSDAGLPGTLYRNVLATVADELADPRGAIDVRNDLQQEIGSRQISEHPICRQRAMLVTHGRDCDPHRTVVQDAQQRVRLDGE